MAPFEAAMAPLQISNLKALLFDAYGTLFDLNSLIPSCNAVFPSQGAELCRLWQARQLEYTQMLNMMGRYEDFWQVAGKSLTSACKALQLECSVEERDRLLDSCFHLEIFADVSPALEVLSRRRPLAILSNASPKMLKVALERNGLQQFFSQIISAGEVGAFKPNLQVYQWAAQKLGLEPANIGLISGTSWDVTGAKAFGLWACWLNRQGASWEDLGFSPDTTVSSLTELPSILGSGL
jgi:2-haloacid dehalogenase